VGVDGRQGVGPVLRSALEHQGAGRVERRDQPREHLWNELAGGKTASAGSVIARQWRNARTALSAAGPAPGATAGPQELGVEAQDALKQRLLSDGVRHRDDEHPLSLAPQGEAVVAGNVAGVGKQASSNERDSSPRPARAVWNATCCSGATQAMNGTPVSRRLARPSR
jgi:hypothetical protein